MVVRRPINDDFRSSYEIILNLLADGPADEEYLVDQLQVLGYYREEVEELLTELQENEAVEKYSGKWFAVKNGDQYNLASKVGTRLRRTSDGTKFVIDFNGNLSPISGKSMEYIPQKQWERAYLIGAYHVLCSCCMNEGVWGEHKFSFPVCHECIAKLETSFEVEESESYLIQEIIYHLRQDEDQITEKDLANVIKVWRAIDGINLVDNRKLWRDKVY